MLPVRASFSSSLETSSGTRPTRVEMSGSRAVRSSVVTSTNHHLPSAALTPLTTSPPLHAFPNPGTCPTSTVSSFVSGKSNSILTSSPEARRVASSRPLHLASKEMVLAGEEARWVEKRCAAVASVAWPQM